MLIVPPGGDMIMSGKGMYVPGGAVAWVPTDIANCSLWLDASLGITLDGSDNVSAWADQSGNDKDAAQTTEADRPDYVTNVVNGKPVVRFEDEYMDLTAVTMGAAHTVFVVAAQNAAYAGGMNIIKATVQWQAPGYLIDGANDSFQVFTNADGSLLGPTDSVDVDGAFHIGRFERTNLTEQIIVTDGGADYTDTAIENRPTATWDYLGDIDARYDIAEMIIYSRRLTDEEIATVEAYLAAKYDITLA